MKLLHTSPSLIELQVLGNYLNENGVEAVLTNDRASFLAGEVPVTELWPELYVAASNFDRAKCLLAERGKAEGSESWQCNVCQESHEAQFMSCWNCGVDRA